MTSVENWIKITVYCMTVGLWLPSSQPQPWFGFVCILDITERETENRFQSKIALQVTHFNNQKNLACHWWNSNNKTQNKNLCEKKIKLQITEILKYDKLVLK